MKLVFLDIDGVLNRAGIRYPGRGPEERYEPICVFHLNRILEETGARLILSSSWRIDWPDMMVEEVLLNWGVCSPHPGALFAGRTGEAPLSIAGAEGRAFEICRFLDQYGLTAARYVALDDLDMSRWVRTCVVDPNRGLTSGDADITIRYLNGELDRLP